MSSTVHSNLGSVTCELMRRACAKFATGITVVTTMDPAGRPHGLTVNSFSSVSCDPPIVSVCIDLRCRVLSALSMASHFAINILADHQRAVSVRFAQACDARFDGIEWRLGTTGVPVLEGVLAAFECRRHSSVDVGDHRIVLGTVAEVEVFPRDPLVYFNSSYRRFAE